MKKLLVILLVLATLMTSTGFLGFLGLGSRTVTDPVLTAFRGEKLPPADYLTPLRDGYTLATFSMRSGRTYTYSQSVYDAAADRNTPITLRPQDSDAWSALIRAAISRKTSSDYTLYLMLLEEQGPSALLQYERLQPYTTGDRYAFCSGTLMQGLLDFRTGELLPLDPTLRVTAITPWDQLLSREYPDAGVRLSLLDLNGRVLHTADLDVGQCIMPVIQPLENGLAVIYSDILNRTEDAVITCLLLDRELKETRRLTLTETLPFNKLSDVACSPETGHLLVGTSCGMLVIPPDGGECLLISESNGSLSSSTTTLPSDRLNSADKTYNMMYVIGFAKDGSYTLLSTKDSGLYKLDLNTLALSQQMTQWELDQYDLILSDMMGMTWDGGEFALYPRGVMRVQNR